MKLTKDQIKEIAENLDMGFRCLIHLKTGEIEAIPDFLAPDWYGQEEEEPWKEIIEKLDENWGDYFEFDKMTSHESFEVMADFAEEVDNKKLQDKLFQALDKPKPFRNFKWEIDNSGKYRQEWFDFKNNRLKEFVADQFERNNIYRGDENR